MENYVIKRSEVLHLPKRATHPVILELKNYVMKNEDNYVLEFDAYLFTRRFLNEVVFKA